MVCGIICSYGQDSIVEISELPDMMKTDTSIGECAVVTFFSKSDNIVLSSSDQSDVVRSVHKEKDGRYSIEVTCDLSDRSVGRDRTFTALIKGTSLKGFRKKRLSSGKRFFFQVIEAEHVLTPWWPETRAVLYPVDGKSAIEFNIPQGIEDLHVKYSDGIGGVIKKSRGKGINNITLEIDCQKLELMVSELDTKLAKLKEENEKLERMKSENQSKYNQDGFDFELAESQVQEQTDKVAHIKESMPHLYVVLYGDNTNQVFVPIDKLKSLKSPKTKLTMGINDALQKTIVGTTALAEKLKSANMAYQGRRFKEALTFYTQASEDSEATEADRTACRGWIETINTCIEAQTEANKSLLLLKNYKEKGGDVNPDKIIELFNVAIANYKTLYSITRNDFYQVRIEKFENSRDKIGYVMNGVVISTDFKQGVLYEAPITGIDIYGVKDNFSKDMKKGIHGDYLGQVDAEGKFHLEIPRNVYEGLLFVPTNNKDFSKNVWQKVKGSTHLDIKITFSKD